MAEKRMGSNRGLADRDRMIIERAKDRLSIGITGIRYRWNPVSGRWKPGIDVTGVRPETGFEGVVVLDLKGTGLQFDPRLPMIADPIDLTGRNRAVQRQDAMRRWPIDHHQV